MTRTSIYTSTFMSFLFVTPSAFANDELVIDLEADVSEICSIFSTDLPEGDDHIDLSFGDLGQIPTTTRVAAETEDGGTTVSVSYVCNLPDGFTRTITSENSGFLFREETEGGQRNRIAFTMTHGGEEDIGFTNVTLTAPRVDNFNGSNAFLLGRTADISFHAFGVLVDDGSGPNAAPFTTVFAGDYFDTVTISVVGN